MARIIRIALLDNYERMLTIPLEVIAMRWRNKHYATGLPGWMRFGYSPGWGGMPPGARYLAQTGQMPRFQDWWAQQAPPPGWWGGEAWRPGPIDKSTELEYLNASARALEDELAWIKQRVEELTKEAG